MSGERAGRTRIATILVVDDNWDSTEALGSLLEVAGYRVIAVTSSAAALEAWERARHRIDLVVTDLAIPGMNGLELVRMLRADGLSVPVVVVSGYAPPAGAPALAAWLRKPVAVEDFLATVARVLGADAPHAGA
jgi:CheY-like chemotaxis protein